MALPKFILLKSEVNNKYLCYSKEKGPNHAFLRFSYEDKSNEKTVDELLESVMKKEKAVDGSDREFYPIKFEVEESKTAEGYVHIRTCYNNKYWVRKSKDSNWIVAEANEPEEDMSKWSCTLFKPVFVDDYANDANLVDHDAPRKIQLVHLGQHYVGTSKTLGEGHEFDLVAMGMNKPESNSSDSGLVFTVVNMEENVVLPEHLTFMGHNDKYLASTTKNGVTYLEFKANDIASTGVAHQRDVIDLGGPHWLIIYRDANALWGLTSPYITLMPIPTSTFYPIKVGDDRIALRCIRNDNFVNCGSGNGMEHVLGASIQTIPAHAQFRVGKPVLRRDITEATYELDDARIYNPSSIEKFRDSRSNNTSVELTGSFQVEYSTSETRSWKHTVTTHIGVTASWSAGIPKIGEFGIEISYDHEDSWEWGQEKTETTTVTFTQNVTIPPRKKMTVKVLAMRAFCDIPFTCKVRDLMTDESVRVYTKNDGMFTGTNEFQFQTIIDEEDL